MNKIITVKLVSGQQSDIVVKSNHKFDDFVKMVRTCFEIDEDRIIKVIHVGKIITSDELFNRIQNKDVVVCIATKPSNLQSITNNNAVINDVINDVNNDTANDPVDSSQLTSANSNSNHNHNHNQVTSQSQSPSPVAVTDSERTQSRDADGNSAEPKYGFQEIKAFTIVFLNFIKSNPQLQDAFLNNYGALVTEIVRGDQLDPVMRSILSRSSQIRRSMEAGENIQININMDNQSMEKIELTEQDRMNIDQFISMGFNPDRVIVEYLKAGKDLNRTLDALQS